MFGGLGQIPETFDRWGIRPQTPELTPQVITLFCLFKKQTMYTAAGKQKIQKVSYCVILHSTFHFSLESQLPTVGGGQLI